MKLSEIQAATTMALDNTIELPNCQYDTTLWGLSMSNFKPVITTLDVVAGFIRYHCRNFDGSLDSTALQELTNPLRFRVKIA